MQQSFDRLHVERETIAMSSQNFTEQKAVLLFPATEHIFVEPFGLRVPFQVIHKRILVIVCPILHVFQSKQAVNSIAVIILLD